MKNLIEVNQMIDNKSTMLGAAANATAAATVSNGVFAYIHDNATVLTFFMGLAGFIIALVFGYLNSKEHKRKTEIMAAQLKLNQDEAARDIAKEEKDEKEDKIIITAENLKK